MATFLVTGATGQQGGATVTALLAAKQHVRAYTRNASSPAAQALAAQGVTVFEGEFSNQEVLVSAAQGCDGVFMNCMPSFTSNTAELEDGREIIKAAKAAGVKHVVYSNVNGLDSTKIDPYLEPGSMLSAYFYNKRTLQAEVKAEFPVWTILQPPSFFSNYLVPRSDFQFPNLSKEGLLKTSYDDRAEINLIDQNDIGKFAAAALLDPKKFNSLVIPIAVEKRTIQSIAEEMASVSGKKCVAVPYTPEEAEKAIISNVQKIWSKGEFVVDLEYVKSFDIPMRGFREYLEANKETLIQTIGPH